MWLALLGGCALGTLTTEDGVEPLRTALAFAPDNTLSLALHDTRRAYLLLANSTLPCAPPEEMDDPATASDEVLAAEQYWDAQLATLFGREGARVVLLVLSVGPEEDWLGRYPLDADAWETGDLAAGAPEAGRVAAGAWLHVEETAVADRNGVLYARDVEIVEEEHDFAVDAPAWVDVSRKDTTVEGEFDFPEAGLAGSFSATACPNTSLLTDLYQLLFTLGQALGGA
jgi:hypothetical protein